eukprot:scaffold21020_cov16-Tisochrysis_lutea.AAC.2
MGILRNGALIAWVQEWASSRAVEARKCDSGRAVEFSGTGAWPWSRALFSTRAFDHAGENSLDVVVLLHCLTPIVHFNVSCRTCTTVFMPVMHFGVLRLCTSDVRFASDALQCL